MSLSGVAKTKEKKTVTCDLCGKTLVGGTAELRQHKTFHVQKTGIDYKCIDCDEVFNDRMCWLEHRSRDHPGLTKKVECSACGKTFLNNSMMKRHYESKHEKKKTEECEICGEKIYKFSLKQHKKAHETQCFSEPKKCFYCEKQLQDSLTFRAHIHENHPNQIGEKQLSSKNQAIYKCGECNYSSTMFMMGKHYTDKHTKGGYIQVQLLKCHHCPVEFHERSERDIHSNTHLDSEGIIQFHCKKCKLSFETPDDYAVHYHEHYAQRPYSCRYCSRKFIAATLCIGHENTKHLAELSDEKVDISDGLTSDEKRNIELRGWQDMLVPGPERNEASELAYFCKECDEKFYGKYRFQLHLDKHKEKIFDCHLCDYSTNKYCHYNRHVNKTHSDYRPFVCEICNESFKDASQLKQHSSAHVTKKYCKCEDCGQEFEDVAVLMHPASHLANCQNAIQTRRPSAAATEDIVEQLKSTATVSDVWILRSCLIMNINNTFVNLFKRIHSLY